MIELPTPLTEGKEKTKLTTDDIHKEVMNVWQIARRHRQSTVESLWDSIYEFYRASVEDLQSTEAKSFYESGNRRRWAHKVNVGKTFEVTETLVSYLKGATFPSDDWFDIRGTIPNLGEAARVVKELAKQKLEEASVREAYDLWVRSIVIYGTATYRVGWRSELQRVWNYTADRAIASNKRVEQLELETMSPYDIWVDTSAPLNRGGTFARLFHTRQELFALAADDYYTIDEEDLDAYKPESHGDPNVPNDSQPYISGQQEIIEYYGPLLVDGVRFWCIHAVLWNGKLIRLTDSDYHCGNPYVHTVMLPNRDSIYGMSVLHPNLGALHVLNALTNSRLDNIALHIDKMWTMVEDGILKQEDVKTEPGAVFKVANHDSLQPVDLGRPDFTVTYQEESIQGATVDRNTATGPLIGMGQPRGGERVTAQEIQAVRDSGGNRLSSLHSHLEDTGTVPMLNRVFAVLQQHYTAAEIVRLYEPDLKVDAFYSVDPEYVRQPYKFVALGASYVVERQRNMSELMQLLDISARAPQLAERLDYEAILEDMLRQMRFTNPKRFIKSAAPPPQQEGAVVDLSESVGGDLTQQAVQAQVMEDGGAELLGNLGIDTEGVDPATMQQALQPAIAPQP